KADQRPLLVISAASGVTNQLLSIARHAVSGNKQSAADELNQLKNRHLSIAEDLITDHDELDAVDHHINDCISRLVNLVEGVSLLGELTNRSLDVFAAQGELMSSFILASAMRENGLSTKWFDVRDVMLTDQNYTAAVPHIPSLQKLALQRLAPLVRTHVVVTQGFIGRTHDGVTTTLGRGGSDYTAALLGSTLSAAAIEIWTDVDGVLTSDPRLVEGASRVRQMSFREAAELAYFGAKVLHPATIYPAVEKNIPVYVYNTHRPESPGTLIAQHVDTPGDHGVIKSIAYKKNITILNIISSRMLLAHGFLASIFDVFKRHHTSVDVVSTTEVSVSLTVDNVEHLEQIVADLSAISQVQIEKDRAIV
ncbi:MAG: aspartate kinase, partial [Bacteroidetes bacterium]|nr:aspartate kinase [Bacteroidota bacterium]